MPYLYQTGTDLAPAQAGGASFSGGQFSAARQSIIPEDAYGKGTNIDNDEYGNAVTRRGSIQIGSGLTGPIQGITQCWYTGITSQVSIVVANGVMNWIGSAPGSAWSSVFGGTPCPVRTGNGVKYRFAKGIARLYVVNGIDNLFSLDYNLSGTLHSSSTTNDPPAACFDVSWHTNRLVLAGPGSKLYFSQFLTGDAGQWNRTLWSLQVGGDNFNITGIMSWSNFDLFVMKEDSLWVVGCNPTYAVSDFTVNPIHKNLGCTAPRTACQVGRDILLLTRIGVIKIDRTTATDTTSEIRDPISKPIQDIINRINWPAVKDNATACYWNNRYLLSVPLDNNTTNVTTLVYNTVTEKWMGSWGETMDGHCFSRYDGKAPERLRFGRYDGKVYEWLDWIKEADETHFDPTNPDNISIAEPPLYPLAAYQDNGVNIETLILSRAYDFDEPDSYKDLSTMKLEFFRSRALADIGLRIDGGDDFDILTGFPTLADSKGLPIALPFYLPHPGIKPKKVDLANRPPCFEVAARVSSSSDKLVLRKIVFTSFIGSMGAEIAEAR